MAKKRTAEAAVADGEFDEAAMVEALAKEYGEETVSLGQPVPARDYVSTQSASLNVAIGRPGIPVGAITNIFGPEASGKSTLVYHLLAETQARGGFAVLYDSEGAYDMDRGARIGVDYDRLIWLDPTTLERVFDQVEKIITDVSVKRPDTLITLAIDSVAGAPARAMLEGEYGDHHPAAQAKAVSQAMPRLVPLIRKTKTALVLVGQTRASMDFSPNPNAKKETQVAEGAIRFYSHLRIRLQKAGEVGEKGKPTGIWTNGYTAKNKTAPPFRSAKFIIDFWNGIDRLQSALEVAQQTGLVQQKGGWYRFEDTSFRSDEFGKVLEANPALEQMILKAPELWIEERLEAA